MKLQYEYELKNDSGGNKKFYAFRLVVMLILSAFLVIDAIYEVNITGKIFSDNPKDVTPLHMLIIAFIIVISVVSSFFNNTILKAKHKRLKNKGIRTEGYITYAFCDCEGKHTECGLEISVYDVCFKIKGVAENEAFNYIYSYNRLLKYFRIPVTVYLYDTEVYADLSSVDVEKFNEFIRTKHNKTQDTYSVYQGSEAYENNTLE